MENSKTGNLAKLFRDSLAEFKSLPSLAGAAMLVAMEVLLHFLFMIPLSETLRISFSFVASAMIGMLYGPVMGMGCGAIADILRYMIKPMGAYFPGYTLTAILSGLVYGLFLYKNKATLLRIIGAKSIVNIILNGGLNTLWSTIISGTPYWVLFTTRITKNCIFLVIESAILFLLLDLVLKRVVLRLRRA